ncbi:MAG TPA: Asd/ArgC dimerization domain-containing protein, partial [Myxococcaceae bacterium]|nr:Asd/ArgC dimerization domain-containing protein [Myxococcaceae bacterium]
RVTALASERSEGSELDYGDETLEVEVVGPDAFRGVQGVFFATPAEVSRKWAPAVRAAGAWAVDLSPAFRNDLTVPLALPAVRPDSLPREIRGRLVRCPSPLTAELLKVLDPVQKVWGLESISAHALFGASFAGTAGVRELETQTANLLSGRELDPALFPHRLAFNLIPQVGTWGEDGATDEERALVEESERLGWALPHASLTAAWAPIFYGISVSLSLRLKAPASAAALEALWAGSKGVKRLDTPAEKIYPMPMLAVSDASVHVGRVRWSDKDPHGLSLFCAWDNAALAAVNAVEAFEALFAKEL